ncbi:protein HGH1 homolog [Condylostylus longicornis]|uniref:protein HGH1 homolog n=1 Tax=Condylostylus longicornis TaxID=2530218 RepID=UPI00244DB261|nr:protein HGH1 homolog [Condylostylus longicornis]
MESLKELSQFLKPYQRLDLKAVSLTHILGLTGSKEGRDCIFQLRDIVESIFYLTQDSNTSVAKDAILSLINLTANTTDAIKIFETSKNIEPKFPLVFKAIESITNKNSELADPWTMVISNLTRVETLVPEILENLQSEEKIILDLVKAFTQIDYNIAKAKLHYLGPIFCNLTQTTKGRELICNSKYNLMEKIIPFTSYNENTIRRGGTIGILKNICFDPVYHDFVLNDKDDILHCLLYPLIGPEEYTDEENEKFPIELQYMPETKCREEDPDLRVMLLECLLQLCATKKHREFLRSKGTYEILREYHKWELNVGKDKKALLLCENVVDILIKKEEEIGLDNYKEIVVPEDISKKFTEDDEKYLNEE